VLRQYPRAGSDIAHTLRRMLTAAWFESNWYALSQKYDLEIHKALDLALKLSSTQPSFKENAEEKTWSVLCQGHSVRGGWRWFRP
jgi:hypothetical protein